MMGRRYSHLEKKFTNESKGADDDSDADKYRRIIIEKSRSIADTFIVLGKVDHRKLEEALESCLRALPVSDFHMLDSVLYKGKFFKELEKERSNSGAITKALAMMHNTEIHMLGEGLTYGEYWEEKSAKVQRIRDEKRTKRKATITRLLSNYGWQAIISVGLIVAILHEFDYYSAYLTILKFAVCAAFAYWGWVAHNLNKVKWRNAFVLVSIFYNPFLPIRLNDGFYWMFINVIPLVLIIANVCITEKCIQGADSRKKSEATPPPLP